MQKIGYFKYWIALVLIATIGVFSFSCNDTDNPGNEGEVLTQAEAEGLINAVFGPLQTLSSSYSFLLESATETTISFEGADDADGPLVSLFETTPSNWYAIKVFNRLYQSIGAANLAIEKISDPKEGANVTGKELLIARARFFRGYNLFQLVQLYGEVPIILSTSQKDVTTRASINDVYTQIVKDLTEAIPDLPANDALKWHPTKAAANTILAKAYLTWGQNPLSQTELEQIKSSKQDPVHTVDNTKLQKAIEYADKVIADGSYRLLNDYNSIWGGGANGAAPENNAEVIFSIYHDGDGIDAQGNHQTHCGFTWPGQATKDPHISYADITLENRIPEGDPRREYSYATSISYDPAGFDAAAKDTLDYIDILTWPISIVRPGKWIHRAPASSDYDVDKIGVQPNDIDHIDFRYAEVLLIKAEAEFFSNTGDKGLGEINQLRGRVGLTPLTAVTAEDVYKEWDYEFAFEQKHWVNLVRWHRLIQAVLNNVPNYEYYKDVYNDSSAFEDFSYNDTKADPTRFSFYSRVYKHLHAKTNKIDGHFYRFPIPLSASYTDLGITPQNPGY